MWIIVIVCIGMIIIMPYLGFKYDNYLDRKYKKKEASKESSRND